jgi:hypothetical protein
MPEDFEHELFALYGEPSAASEDAGVAERILRRIEREALVRDILSAAAIAAVVAAVVGAIFPPLMDLIAPIAAPPLAHVASFLAGAAALGVVATRLILDA